MAEKRKRAQNFSPQDKEKLVRLLQLYRKTILNKKMDGPANEAKAQAWDSITLKFNSSCSYPRTKDSLMKLWEKLKSEAKLRSNGNNQINRTGGGLDRSTLDSVLDLIVDIMGRGCTGIEEGYDPESSIQDAQLIKEEHFEPIIIVTEKDSYDSDAKEDLNNTDDVSKYPYDSDAKEDLNNTDDPFAENERRYNARSERMSSCEDITAKKMCPEALKLQLLREELTFKRELHRRQLEEMHIKIETASYERDIKKQVLSKLKDGTICMKCTSGHATTGALSRPPSPVHLNKICVSDLDGPTTFATQRC